VTGGPAPGGEAGGRGWLALRGTQGILRGEVLLVAAGREATVGRGSGSTLPLTRSAGYRAMSVDPVLLRQACQGVSRRHFRVAVPAPGEAVVEDLSRAGTYVDGSRIEAPLHLRDLRDRSHELRFGRGEVVELRWIDAPAGPAAAGGA